MREHKLYFYYFYFYSFLQLEAARQILYTSKSTKSTMEKMLHYK